MRKDEALALLNMQSEADDIEEAYRRAMQLNQFNRYSEDEKLRNNAEERCALIEEARNLLINNSSNTQNPNKDALDMAREDTDQSKASTNEHPNPQQTVPLPPKVPIMRPSSPSNTNMASLDSSENDEIPHSMNSHTVSYASNDSSFSDNSMASNNSSDASCITIFTTTETPINEPNHDFPALENWHTSIGFSIYGVLVSAGIYWFGTFLLFNVSILAYVLFLVTITLGYLLYSLLAYTSFFGKHPCLTSSTAISFLNCAIGSWIFGPLWNHNLTVRKKGGSYALFAILQLTGCVLLLATLSA